MINQFYLCMSRVVIETESDLKIDNIQEMFFRWKNFLSTGNYFTEVELDRNPTTLIIGENVSHKSTILDNIMFCFVQQTIQTSK